MLGSSRPPAAGAPARANDVRSSPGTSARPLPPSQRRQRHQRRHSSVCYAAGEQEAADAVTRRQVLQTAVSVPALLLPQTVLADPLPQTPLQPVPGPTILTDSSSQQLGFVPRVQEFTLPNGLHFIVLPRSVAPVASVHVLANVGAYQEEEGQTGLAHLLEHMAFKGTRRVGARDWQREAPLLDAMDEVFYELRDLKASQSSVNASRIKQLEEKMTQLQAEAEGLVVPNAFGALLTRAGGVGLNASTAHDETRYFLSLPANKLELWFAMEAERFRAPVFRELYSEKKVIEEERRLRVDDAPLGRFQQEFASRALKNNYRRPVIGWAEDFDGLGRREVANFFARYYGPNNLTIAIVGDVTPEQVYRWAVQYWGGWAGASANPSQSQTPGSTTVQFDRLVATRATGSLAAQSPSTSSLSSLQPSTLYATNNNTNSTNNNNTSSTNSVSVLGGSACSSGLMPEGGPCYADTSVGGPLVMLGFPRPPATSPEGPTLQVLSDLLSGSRTSRLTGRLLLQRQALRGVRCVSSYPGDKYDSMCLFAAVPLQGQRPEDAERLVVSELDKFVSEGPTQAELSRVQKGSRTSVLASALSNSAMASLLASYHTATGSWRGLLKELDQVAALRPSDVRDVAEKTLNRKRMFTGYVYAKK